MGRRIVHHVVAGFAAVLLSAGIAMATTPVGLWQGRYECAQGETALALQIIPGGPGRVHALFYFHALAGNPAVPSGCFAMTGRYDRTTRRIVLRPTLWLAQPRNFVWVGLTGQIGTDGTGMTGRINGPGCTDFALVRSMLPPVPPAPAACRMERIGPTV